MLISVLYENPSHLAELLTIPEVSAVYLPGERLSRKEAAAAGELCRQAGKKAYYAFPYVFRREAADYYEKEAETLRQGGWDGFLVRNLDEAGFLREKEISGCKIYDAGLYSWNREAISVFHSLGADLLTAPYELNEKELRARGLADTEVVIYGRLPVMISAQCTALTSSGTCQKGSGEYSFQRLKDRKGAIFLAENRCRFCYNVIYNSVPLWLLDKAGGLDRVRFHFTSERTGEPSRFIREFLSGRAEPPEHFTRGHFTRGVE
ncbi:hypothetical protein MUB23_11370 [Cuneatibacter sp. NSJ-177]|uniref:hypothetical protein n=1 Tax=Cuneatibacter sp. NSJ-177 TaxID=2931401 RepID=UPI001FD25B39|nr:hypothetical protein [Cuneatibacter sp. NSJ-177]MCJ7835984.1 hypothetical protein [Cuneatibacter sp. NSJ-177]